MQKILQFLTTRAVLIALGIVVVSLLVWVIASVRHQEKENRMDAVRAIPSDAVYVLRVNKLNKINERLKEQGALFALFRKDKSTRDFVNTLQWLVDTLTLESPMIADFAQQSWWISAHIFDTHIKYLFAADIPNRLYSNDVQQMTSLLARIGLTASEKSYEDEKITTFKRHDEEIFHAAIVRRVLVVSSSRILVENAIRNARVASALIDVPHFSTSAATAGANVDINLYVQHSQLTKFLSIYCRSPYHRNTPVLAHLGNFLTLDATLNSNGILLNGLLFNRDKKDSYFTALQHQDKQTLTIPDILPRTTNGVYSFSISNVKRLLSDYVQYHNNFANGSAAYSNAITKLQQKIYYEPPRLFTELYPTEVALAHVPIAGVSKDDQWFIIIKSSKITQATKTLTERIAFAAKQSGKSEGKYQQKVLMANNEPITVYNNPVQGVTETLMGTLFTACADKHYWLFGDYIIFSSSSVSLKEFALATLAGRTLSHSVNMSNYSAAESNIFIYLNPKKNSAGYLDVFKPQAQSGLLASSLLAESEAIGIQLSFMNDNELYCNAFYTLQGNPTNTRSAHTLPLLFESKLEAPLRSRPWQMKNHRNNQNELLVQDTRNTIYLIDNQGAILWRRTLNEPVLGNVQQIDILKNNKFQMVLNTKSKIYIIDRLGKDVAPYPLSLPASASAPMAVFDYDHSRDYRFFVPCLNGKIYAYEANTGKALTGFAPTITFGGMVQPVMHVRRAGKDFIVATDNRNVYLLDRKGTVRLHTDPVFPAVNAVTACENNANSEPARLTVTNPNGELVFISLVDGKVEKMPLSHSPKEYHHFLMNAQNDYIFLNNKDLTVYSSNLKQKFSVSTKEAAKEAPLCFSPDDKSCFYSVYSADEGKAYLWNSNGKVVEGFPMSASAPAVVTKLKKTTAYQVIVGDPNGYLMCYTID
ncbi:hypothetical protein FACS189452_03520 [Bacteroidia bacterium]|nr:hypothetical protein FACS189452_03520 [Bacteroidia bacterium]GHT80985.1 hypothetical protein FACS189467_4270 [Bacteroidia bacterium]